VARYVTPCSHNAAASETPGSLHNCSIVSSSNRDIFCSNSFALISAQPAFSSTVACTGATATTVTPDTATAVTTAAAGTDERLIRRDSNSTCSSISSCNNDDYCNDNGMLERQQRCLSAPSRGYRTDSTVTTTNSAAAISTATVVYNVRRVASGSSGGRRVRAPYAGDARAFEVAGTGHNDSFSSSVSSSSGMRGSTDDGVTWLLTRHRPTLRLVSACLQSTVTILSQNFGAHDER
jgi:hypothetical protein